MMTILYNNFSINLCDIECIYIFCIIVYFLIILILIIYFSYNFMIVFYIILGNCLIVFIIISIYIIKDSDYYNHYNYYNDCVCTHKLYCKKLIKIIKCECFKKSNKYIFPIDDNIEISNIKISKSTIYNQDKCIICLGDLKGYAYKLICDHLYHEECIVRWLNENTNNNCPICRKPIN
jgi:hypothetical protein